MKYIILTFLLLAGCTRNIEIRHSNGIVEDLEVSYFTQVNQKEHKKYVSDTYEIEETVSCYYPSFCFWMGEFQFSPMCPGTQRAISNYRDVIYRFSYKIKGKDYSSPNYLERERQSIKKVLTECN